MKKFLIILGAPLWIPLLLTFFIILLSLYLVLWVISILLAAANGLVLVLGIFYLFNGNITALIASLGALVALIGLTYISFTFTKSVTKNSLDYFKSLLPFKK